MKHLANFGSFAVEPATEPGCKIVNADYDSFSPQYDVGCSPSYYARQPYVYVPAIMAFVLILYFIFQTTQKHVRPKISVIFISIASVTAVSLGLFASRDWIKTSYYRPKIEKALTTELTPLMSRLAPLGFSNQTNLDTTCDSNGLLNQFQQPGIALYCSSRVDRMIAVPDSETGKNQFIVQSDELDKALKINRWRLNSDTPTRLWIEKLVNGGEFQPNQNYTRQLDDIICSVDLWTAYSEPDPPAMSIGVACLKN